MWKINNSAKLVDPCPEELLSCWMAGFLILRFWWATYPVLIQFKNQWSISIHAFSPFACGRKNVQCWANFLWQVYDLDTLRTRHANHDGRGCCYPKGLEHVWEAKHHRPADREHNACRAQPKDVFMNIWIYIYIYLYTSNSRLCGDGSKIVKTLVPWWTSK